MFDRRLTIVTGKGGVGRSAVASAIARARAHRGERVLALAIDRGAGLAAHLGEPGLDHDPVEVGPLLHGAVADPASALDEYVGLRVGSMPLALASRLFRGLALTVPGVRDIVLIGKAWYEAERRDWDAVVVDATPAGQIQSILHAAGTIADLVPRGSVHDQARAMQAALADAATTEMVVVSTAEELALTEAEEVFAASDSAGVSTTRMLVLNRVLPQPDFTGLPPASGPIHDAASLHFEMHAAQQRATRKVTADLSLPLLFGTHSPTDVSTTLAEALEVSR